jgi:peptide/nickel transport system permease protein
MLFGKKKQKEIADSLQNASSDQRYWAIVKKQFKRNRIAVWSLRILYILLFIGITSDFLANEKPIYCKINGQSYFPVLHQYFVDFGWSAWNAVFINKDWSEHDYESVVFPLIPYSASSIDLNNQYRSPFGPQQVESKRYWHWLGTDGLGRDVTAGMIRGTRIALMVGIVSMSIASVIGIFLGAIAGYFGDERLKTSWTRLILNIIGFVLAIFYGFIRRSFQLTESGLFGREFLKSLLIASLLMFVVNIIANALKKIFSIKSNLKIAADIMVMRLIEIMNSIPTLIFLLAVLAIIEKPSIINIMVIIGLLIWTGIARFIRAELLRVRQLDYIDAAQSMGFGELRILLRHAIPNSLTPVLITIAFGVASSILIEAFLSFLGIGVPPSDVTWGSMLNLSRLTIKAWWLAILPGSAIFVTVSIFNLIGEGLSDAFNPKLRQ